MRYEAVNPYYEDIFVMGTVEDADVSAGWNLLVNAPKENTI